MVAVFLSKSKLGHSSLFFQSISNALIKPNDINGTMRFEKFKQVFEYQCLLLEISGGKCSNLYINVGSFFQHHRKLDICGILRRPFYCIGV